MKKQELTQELLKTLIDYNPDTGVFTWRERDIKWFNTERSQRDCNAWNTRYSGEIAGSITKTGSCVTYRQITIIKKTYVCHHLAYFYMTGNWPINDIDCIDGDFTNIKYNNIRECTRTDTMYKKVTGCKNKLMGVYLNNAKSKYKSIITIDGKKTYLGTFRTPEEAHSAYVEAKRQISPEFNML